MTLANALFIGWNRPIAGREAAAGELFQAMANLFGSLQKQGKIENAEPCLLTTHGGDMNGFWIVKGSADQINDLRNNEDFYKLIVQCTSVIDGFGRIEAYTGDAVHGVMGDWMKMLGSLK